jgi:hypothetical protein
METGPQLTAAELRNRVLALQQKKVQQEQSLKESFQDLVQSVNPVQIVKNSLHKLSEDQQVKTDLTKVAISLGVHVLMRTYFGRKRGIKVYAASLAIEKLAIPFIREHWTLVEALANRFSGSTPTDAEAEEELQQSHQTAQQEPRLQQYPLPGPAFEGEMHSPVTPAAQDV